MTDASYHPNNLNLVPHPDDALVSLADMARNLGVLIHIEGIPFGDSDMSSRTTPLLTEEDSQK